jgi:hypothetical protein
MIVERTGQRSQHRASTGNGARRYKQVVPALHPSSAPLAPWFTRGLPGRAPPPERP